MKYVILVLIELVDEIEGLLGFRSFTCKIVNGKFRDYIYTMWRLNYALR